MKNNKQNKRVVSHNAKEEKRRSLLNKKHVKKERNQARYGVGSGAALVVAKPSDMNRRFVAAFLALVFAISCLVVGVNFSGKAVEGSDVAADGVYSGSSAGITDTSTGTQYYVDANVTVENGQLVSVGYDYWYYDENDDRATAYDGNDNAYSTLYLDPYWNQQIQSQIIGNSATTATVDAVTMTAITNNSITNGNALKNAIRDALQNAPAASEEARESTLRPNSISAGGFVTSKKLEVNPDGNYDLTLEAYSTGEKITELIPTDYVLVVDQSGSMSTKDMAVEFDEGETDRWYLSQKSDKELGAQYVKDPTDGNYYRVYRKKGYMYEYIPRNTLYAEDAVDESNLHWFASSRTTVADVASQYYYRPCEDQNAPSEVKRDETFYPVTVSSKGEALYYSIRFRYTDSTGTQRYLEYVNNPTNTTANKDKETGNAIWYRNPSGDYFGPGDSYLVVFRYNGIGNNFLSVNDFVTGWVNDSSSYSYGEINFRLIKMHTGMYVQNPLFKRYLGYNELCYKSNDGEEHTLIKSTFCGHDSDGNLVAYGGSGGIQGTRTDKDRAYWDGTMYTPTRTITRLEALQNSLDSFVTSVANQTNSNGTKPDNRIAIVGFSSVATEDPYRNTELLTGTDLTVSDESFIRTGSTYYSLDNPYTNHNGIQYSTASYSDYAKALLSVNDPAHREKIDKAVHSLTAYGGTEPYYGFEMAHNILLQRDPESLWYTTASGEQARRNQVVIYFTDGRPGNTAADNQYSYANDVVSAAHDIKSDTSIGDTPIYSIGTFGEADANPLTYRRTTERGIFQEDAYIQARLNAMYSADVVEILTDYGFDNSTGRASLDAYLTASYRLWQNGVSGFGPWPGDTIADYMEAVSSKYPDAERFVNPAWYGGSGTKEASYETMLDNIRRTDTKSENRYYYLATDVKGLTSAFQNISKTISSSVTGITIDSNNSLTRDVISNKFQKIDGKTTVEVYTEAGSTSIDGTVDHWSGERVPATSQYQPEWTDKVLDIHGFDYSTNYIASGHPGNKLIIVIKDIVPVPTETTKENNTLYSNTADIGILDGTTLTSYASFPRPYITRHSYTLNVGEEKADAAFAWSSLITNASGTAVNPDAKELEDVVVHVGDSRDPYTTSSPTGSSISSAVTPNVIYYENVPEDYLIKNSLTTSDDAYTYYLKVDNESDSERQTMIKDTPAVEPLSYADHVLRINSQANSRTVTIKEAVDDSAFASNQDSFTPALHLYPPSGKSIDSYSGNDWEQDGTNEWLVPKTTVPPLKADGTVSISLAIPSGWSLHVDQVDTNNYAVKSATYAVGQTEESSNYPTGGWSWTITDDATITIVNTRPDIPVTGIEDSSNHNWIIYILAVLGGLAIIGAGIFLWKKKDEFVEE